MPVPNGVLDILPVNSLLQLLPQNSIRKSLSHSQVQSDHRAENTAYSLNRVLDLHTIALLIPSKNCFTTKFGSEGYRKSYIDTDDQKRGSHEKSK